ncbi:hypothetical protein [Streptomyces sp. NPDC047868]|uniref:hypothetical protein n=1 Tax=Streptomyces sp. NPDC047868 TaxID=3155480 RepID=UPI003452B473
MAKWKITSYNRNHRPTGTTEVEATSIDSARAAADQVENQTGAKFTTIAKESRVWGFVTQPRH